MKLVIALIVVLAIFLPAQVRAQGWHVVNCDGCTPDEMFQAGSGVVLAAAYSDPHVPVYVTNVFGNSVILLEYAHNAGPDFNWESDPFEAWAVSKPVDPAIQQFIANIHSVVGSNNLIVLPSASGASVGQSSVKSSLRAAGAPQVRAQEGAQYPGSAYDVVASPARDQSVRDFLLSGNGSTWQAIVNFANQFGPLPIIGFSPANLKIVYTVHFADGSKAKYTWDTTERDMKRVPGSVRDSWNNVIPETKADVAPGGYREYDFNEGKDKAYDDFIDRLNQLQVPVSYGGSSGLTVRVACSQSGDSIRCEVVIL